MTTQKPIPSPMTEAQIQAVHIGAVKPLNGTITLVEYDPTWPQIFARKAARIRAALGDRALLLEHVGSTSVPGLAAKPRSDMLLVVADTADEPAYVPALEAAGYVLHIRAPAWYEHRLFKGPDTDIRVYTDLIFPEAEYPISNSLYQLFDIGYLIKSLLYIGLTLLGYKAICAPLYWIVNQSKGQF